MGEDIGELNSFLPPLKLGELVGVEVRGTEEVSLLSGLVTQDFGRFQFVGDAVKIGPWTLQVEGVVRTRVLRLKLARQSESKEPSVAETNRTLEPICRQQNDRRGKRKALLL
jgi:Transporter associated domain